MAIMKVLELMSDSKESWEDATEKAVKKARKSVNNIRSVWVQDFAATVDDDGNLIKYRVTVKVTFEVK